MCCLLSKLFPLISRLSDDGTVIWPTNTCWYCNWHLVAFKWDCTLWITCTFLCTVSPLWFYSIHLNVHIICSLKAYNWPCCPFWPNSFTVFYCKNQKPFETGPANFSVFTMNIWILNWMWLYSAAVNVSLRSRMFFYTPTGEVITFLKLQFPHLCIYNVTGDQTYIEKRDSVYSHEGECW